MRKDDVGGIWKEYFGDQYNVDRKNQVTVNMYGLEGTRRKEWPF